MEMKYIKSLKIDRYQISVFFNPLIFIFLVPSSEEKSFWPPSKVYISVIITHILYSMISASWFGNTSLGYFRIQYVLECGGLEPPGLATEGVMAVLYPLTVDV